MNYQQTLNFIHNIPRFNKNLGLEKMSALLELMGNPQDKLKFIHVAGTNGKGSTCAMLSYIFAEAGYKTGLYISPYVIEFRERIQINNQMIPKEELVKIAKYVKFFWEQLKAVGEPPSEFEVVLAVALEYFVRSGCELVVLEVGMGGRLDATNVIPTPLISVIASVSIDHTFNLGNNIGAIAKEKAGIIKPNGITVCYPYQAPEALAVIMQQCGVMNNQLIIPHHAEVLDMDLSGSIISYDNYQYKISLIGQHQIYNTLMVLEVCNALKQKDILISKKIIAKGIAKTKFPSRLEILSKNPLVILDGAHNVGGAEILVKALEMVPNKKVHGIMGMVEDKDIDSVLKIIAPSFASVVATWDSSNPRFISPERLANKLKKYCDNVQFDNDPAEAYKRALGNAEKDDVILICGSLYLGSILRETIQDT